MILSQGTYLTTSNPVALADRRALVLLLARSVALADMSHERNTMLGRVAVPLCVAIVLTLSFFLHARLSASSGSLTHRAVRGICPFPFARSQLKSGIRTNQLKVQIAKPLQDKAVAMIAVSGLLRSMRAICPASCLSSGRVRLA